MCSDQQLLFPEVLNIPGFKKALDINRIAFPPLQGSVRIARVPRLGMRCSLKRAILESARTDIAGHAKFELPVTEERWKPFTPY